MLSKARNSGDTPGADAQAARKAARRSMARRAAAWLRRGERSAVALELGIIAIPFFMMFLGVMEVSYDLYVQASMDNAVDTAARAVQIGTATGQSGENSATFTAANVCSNLGGLLDCSLLTVGVVPIPTGLNYYTFPIATQLTQSAATNGTGICTGQPGQMMVLKAWYDGPSFVGLLVPSFTTQWTPPGAQHSQTVHVTSSTAGFVNEWFPGAGQTSGGACSV